MAAATDDTPPPDYRYLGKLGRTFQLAGGLRFYPAGDAGADAVARVERVFVEGLGPTRVREVRTHGTDILVFLGRARTREKAQALVNAGVWADPADLPEGAELEPSARSLIGLPVVLASGARPRERDARDDGPGAHASAEAQALGEVADILVAPGNDLLVVDGPRGRFLVPLHAPYVALRDARVWLVDPPDGLWD